MDGEIDLLDAEVLTENDAVTEGHPNLSHGNKEDDQAIASIRNRLLDNKKYANRSKEELDDLAIDLYNLGCKQVSAGCSQQQLLVVAELFSEDPVSLKQRLS